MIKQIIVTLILIIITILLLPHNEPLVREDVNILGLNSTISDHGMSFDEFMSANWHENNQYELDVFDCSNMALYMSCVLENSGYNTTICIRLGKPGHAWIMVEIDNKMKAYECTNNYFTDNSSYYNGTEYNNINDIYDNSGYSDKFLAKEFPK